MSAVDPQTVLSMINEQLEPHGVKCRDMSLVVTSLSRYFQVCQNLMAHHDRAAILFNTTNASDSLKRLLTIMGGGEPPGARWAFLHNDNYYCPPVGTMLSLEQQIRNVVELATGTVDDTCAICMERIRLEDCDMQETKCGHRFHLGCMRPLTKSNRPHTIWHCPLCRCGFQVAEPVAIAVPS